MLGAVLTAVGHNFVLIAGGRPHRSAGCELNKLLLQARVMVLEIMAFLKPLESSTVKRETS